MTPLAIAQSEINALGEFPSAYIHIEDLPIKQVLPPPPDVKEVIDKFAEYVLKNGQEFEANSKARATERLSFLNPSDPAHEYYRWKVYDGWSLRDRATQIAASYRVSLEKMLRQQEQEQLQQQRQQQTSLSQREFQKQDISISPQIQQQQQQEHQYSDAMPREEEKSLEKDFRQIQGKEISQLQQDQLHQLQSEGRETAGTERNNEANTMTGDERETLIELLGKLEPKKSVIKTVGDWAKKRNGSAREITEILYQFFSGLRKGDFERKISVVYLVSDITSIDERYRKACERVVGDIMSGTIQDSRGEKDLERIRDILGIWERSKVFGAGTLKRQRDECDQPLKQEPERKRRWDVKPSN